MYCFSSWSTRTTLRLLLKYAKENGLRTSATVYNRHGQIGSLQLIFAAFNHFSIYLRTEYESIFPKKWQNSSKKNFLLPRYLTFHEICLRQVKIWPGKKKYGHPWYILFDLWRLVILNCYHTENGSNQDPWLMTTFGTF